MQAMDIGLLIMVSCNIHKWTKLSYHIIGMYHWDYQLTTNKLYLLYFTQYIIQPVYGTST